ncbi:MAG: hypothetical protein JO209_09700 [Acidisphaera sp.]|nr:hypothetical protein [Acidisphaera sp.]
MAESDDPAVAAQRLAMALDRIADLAGREPPAADTQEPAELDAMRQRVAEIAARLDGVIAELRAALAR